jgi:ankyrin repeat protein
MDPDGNTPLMRAIIEYNTTKVKQILTDPKQHINPNRKNNNQQTALMLLCSYDIPMYTTSENHTGSSTVLHLVDLLLNIGADINMKDKNGYTPLMLAAYNVHPLIVDRLIKSNRVSDINETTNSSLFASGKTALDLAKDDKNIKHTDSTYGQQSHSYGADDRYMLGFRQAYVIDALTKAASPPTTTTTDGGGRRRTKKDGTKKCSPRKKK